VSTISNHYQVGRKDIPVSFFSLTLNCVLLSSSHPGCSCTAGFEGEHCQYQLGQAPSKLKDDATGAAILFTMTVMSIGTMLLFVIVVRKRRKDSEENISFIDSSDKDSNSGDNRTFVDQAKVDDSEEDEMKDIEII